MCLTINRIHHPYKEELFDTETEACRWANNNPTLPKPYVAVEDMEVYKVLLTDNKGNFKTPTMEHKIQFKRGKCKLGVEKLGCKPCSHKKTFEADAPSYELFTKWVNNFIVEEGIHAYSSCQARVTLPSRIKGKFPWDIWRPYIFKAIIPKGTKFYYGLRGDVVAEKLIIYERKDI